jgi:hypothetical protein
VFKNKSFLGKYLGLERSSKLLTAVYETMRNYDFTASLLLLYSQSMDIIMDCTCGTHTTSVRKNLLKINHEMEG